MYNDQAVSDSKFLLEMYSITRKQINEDPTTKTGLLNIIQNTKKFNTYLEGLSENIRTVDKGDFKELASNIRLHLLESYNASSTITPYATMTFPLFSVFYPRLCAKEQVTILPMPKPAIMRQFLVPIFKKYNPLTKTRDTYQAPAPTYDKSQQFKQNLDNLGGITSGPRTTMERAAAIDVPTLKSVKISDSLGAIVGVDHIQPDFKIYKIEYINAEGTLAEKDVNIEPVANGTIAAQVDISTQSTAGVDFLSGKVDYNDMTVSLSSADAKVKKIYFTVSISLEDHTYTTETELSFRQFEFRATDRTIKAAWSLQQQQDAEALYNINLQSQLVAAMGNQMALDIDREIINELISIGLSNIIPDSNRQTFDLTPPSTFVHGPKAWIENIFVKMNDVSGSIEANTNMGAGNIALVNSQDAAKLESTNQFSYTPNAGTGRVGYSVGTTSTNKWKILISPNIPKGYMPILYKPTEEIQTVYAYQPYVPGVISPYPLGSTPSLSILTRYDKKLIRPNGIGLLQIENSGNV